MDYLPLMHLAVRKVLGGSRAEFATLPNADEMLGAGALERQLQPFAQPHLGPGSPYISLVDGIGKRVRLASASPILIR